jgi:hypothetical protein
MAEYDHPGSKSRDGERIKDMKVARKSKGTVSTETVVINNVTKEKVYSDAETKQLEGPPTSGLWVGTVRLVVPVKLSFNFQSIGIEAGVELSWNMPPGDEVAVKDAFAFAHKVVDAEIAEHVSGLRETLQNLSG